MEIRRNNMSEILSFIFGGMVGFIIMFFVYKNNSKKIELVNEEYQQLKEKLKK